ncbi:hypothetical protein [Amycolatopsis rubida]|uniref:Uncharacterized protein n=1 Tax=Amycolatopsis rubida TaxID=112413 RepID=A0A1I5XB25_9PSEU|nr:hypothetical protein [Amycolatopsis rubida]SFQ29165.1 hypothetical protein SAMN05421854_110133 [Amycolatopsis rubida]
MPNPTSWTDALADVTTLPNLGQALLSLTFGASQHGGEPLPG